MKYATLALFVIWLLGPFLIHQLIEEQPAKNMATIQWGLAIFVIGTLWIFSVIREN